MMRYFIGAYWGKRKQSKHECAEHISKIISFVDNFLPIAHDLQDIRSSSIVKIDNLQACLHENRDDSEDNKVIAPLGYSFQLHMTSKSYSVSISGSMGKYGKIENSSNTFIIELKEVDIKDEVLNQIFEMIIAELCPENAVVHDEKTLSELYKQNPMPRIYEFKGIYNYAAK